MHADVRIWIFLTFGHPWVPIYLNKGGLNVLA